MNATRILQSIANRFGFKFQKGPTRTGLCLVRLSKVFSDASRQSGAPLVVIALGDLPQVIQSTPRLHLGCGSVFADEYINIDNLNLNTIDVQPISLHASSSSVASNCGKYYLQCDITSQLSLPAQSVMTIYSSHFLEHLDFMQANKLLSQCFHALKPGGCLRIVVPDFELWSRKYLQRSGQFFRWYQGSFLGDYWDPIQTCCTTFNGLIYGHHHRSMYDLETLSAKLNRVGFNRVNRRRWGQSSQIHNITELEPFDSIRRHESLIVEARK